MVKIEPMKARMDIHEWRERQSPPGASDRYFPSSIGESPSGSSELSACTGTLLMPLTLKLVAKRRHAISSGLWMDSNATVIDEEGCICKARSPASQMPYASASRALSSHAQHLACFSQYGLHSPVLQHTSNFSAHPPRPCAHTEALHCWAGTAAFIRE